MRPMLADMLKMSTGLGKLHLTARGATITLDVNGNASLSVKGTLTTFEARAALAEIECALSNPSSLPTIPLPVVR